MLNLDAPCTYQGGKSRLVNNILDYINNRTPLKNKLFIDLCCGSGSVGLKALDYCDKVVMVDKGEMGNFYANLDKFVLSDFKKEIDKLPNIDNIRDYLTDLSKQEVPEGMKRIYTYLLLQSGAFGGKQIWIKDNKWGNNSFRSYWKPTEKSNRKSPVNPMMPMPEVMYKRIEKILSEKGRLIGFCEDINDFVDRFNFENCIVYIDPPYESTAKYIEKVNIYDIIGKLKNKVPLYISYNKDLGADEIEIFGQREKGNMNGNRKKEVVREILNYYSL